MLSNSKTRQIEGGSLYTELRTHNASERIHVIISGNQEIVLCFRSHPSMEGSTAQNMWGRVLWGDGQGLTPVFGSADAGEDRINILPLGLLACMQGPPRQELDELMEK